jgi:hypothetical protein
MKKLNGWKRIGILASLTWMVCAGIHTCNSGVESSVAVASLMSNDCVKIKPLAECEAREQDFLSATERGDEEWAALVAIVPVPFGWGAVYLALFLVRWVKDGFEKSDQSTTKETPMGEPEERETEQ